MPPAKKEPSKAEVKAKQKILEDKTFGLKNKNKSAKVTKYVQQLEQNLLGSKRKPNEQDRQEKARLKEEEEKRKAELNALFKQTIVQPKVPFGVDPKTVLCAFFKAGQCNKGDKCKYAHSLQTAQAASNASLEEKDALAEEAEKKSDPLEAVSGKRCSSAIVCKFFLEAVDSGKFGWFWNCPNGGDKCHYSHTLSPGYVPKCQRAKKEDGEEMDTISLEEFLEVERNKIAMSNADLIPVTWESFAEWKAKRKAKREEADREREAACRSGKAIASGRELFSIQPELFKAAEDADEGDVLDEFDLTHREESVEVEDESLFLAEQIQEIDLEDE
jgi:hypothetical protein